MTLIKPFFITLSALLFVCTLSAQDTEKVSVEWKEYSAKNFTLNHPSDWELDETGQMGTTFILFSPPSDPQDKFRENINLLIQDIKGYNLDLDKYTEISLQQVTQMITEPKILANERRKANERDFHELIYTGKQGIYELQFQQYYWIVEDKAYILTFTAEVAEFENFKEAGSKILNSFLIQ